MTDRLYEKCRVYDFQKLFNRKGYAYFTKGAYNLNIIGVRRNTNNKVTNKFDDYLVVIWNTPTGKIYRKVYSITTEPGIYYMSKHLINPKGTAILVPGQYRGCWQIGKHQNKYKALCQKKAVCVYRDNNYDEIYDMKPETIEKGIFGINIHRSDEFRLREEINKYSAGCQVFKDPIDYYRFILLCEKQAELYGNSFTYTLVKEEDLV